MLVGEREELRTRGTKDPALAKVKHAAALAEIEAKWANLRSGQKSLTEREAHHMAAPFYDRWLQRHLKIQASKLIGAWIWACGFFSLVLSRRTMISSTTTQRSSWIGMSYESMNGAVVPGMGR